MIVAVAGCVEQVWLLGGWKGLGGSSVLCIQWREEAMVPGLHVYLARLQLELVITPPLDASTSPLEKISARTSAE